MVILDLKWEDNEEWIIWNSEKNEYEPKSDAPQFVKDSYEHYLQQIKYYSELEAKTGMRYL